MGKHLSQPVYQLLGLENVPKPGFFTVGLDTPETMVRNALSFKANTPYLKIKVDGDVDRCIAVLAALHAALFPHGFDGPVPLWY